MNKPKQHRLTKLSTAIVAVFLLISPIGATAGVDPTPGKENRVFSAVYANPAQMPYPPTHSVPAVHEGKAFLYYWGGIDLAKISVSFLGKTHTATATPIATGHGNAAQLLLAIPLNHKASGESLTWTAFDANGKQIDQHTTALSIRKGSYPVQSLTLDQKYVTPDPELKERIKKERVLIRTALNTVSPTRYWELPMLRPVPGTISSQFGLKRVLNGQPRAPHTGLDFRAAAGDPITTVAKGKVVLTGDFYFSGNCAVVDHGIGVISIYMHMSEIKVQQGQMVHPGDTIGLVGSTGRSTGPHLHLGMAVYGIMTDAFSFIPANPGDLKYSGQSAKQVATPSKSARKNMKKAATKRE